MRNAGRYQTITDMIVSEIQELKKTIDILSSKHHKQSEKIKSLTAENRDLMKQIKKLTIRHTKRHGYVAEGR